MFSLPVETEVDLLIRDEILGKRAFSKPQYRTIYSEQVRELWWRNKLSKENFAIEHASAFPELEIFETYCEEKTLDKRLLREIDRAIPYYILHVLTYEDKHQILLANKKMVRGNIRVENYIRSSWLGDKELTFDFTEKSIDRLYESLEEQVLTRAKSSQKNVSEEESNAFLRYFQKMVMSRSYKPVLVMATLQYGGQISVQNAAAFFRRYYAERIRCGLPIEQGTCVYSDPGATEKEIEDNLIRNPITALCGSGYFTYDKATRTFSLAPGLYDALTTDEIDGILQICRGKITEYFQRR